MRFSGGDMNSLSRRTFCSLATMAAIALSVSGAAPPSDTARIVAAAEAFLATLDPQQRQKVLYAFNDEQQRARWSNLPTAFIPRGGISLKQMNPAQRASAMSLLSAVLSEKGYEKVQQIMEGDEVNKTTDVAFNLGIESMQMVVVAVTLPSLLLLSRTEAYTLLRIGGAVLAGAASAGWIVERIFGLQSSVDVLLNVAAHRAVWFAGLFFLVSLVCWNLKHRQRSMIPPDTVSLAQT
jgi:hypothetical protein